MGDWGLGGVKEGKRLVERSEGGGWDREVREVAGGEGNERGRLGLGGLYIRG